jgi:DNA mismatch repair protein MutS2
LPERLAPIAPIVAGTPRAELPDLLNPEPTLTVDAAALEKVLAFSFVAGDDAGVLATALDAAPIAASAFEPSCFFDELFVTELVQSAMRVQIGGRPVAPHLPYLLRLLSQPPHDARAVEQRRAVWRELAEQRETRHAIEQLYLHLTDLRRLFEGENRVGIRGEQARRRIDVLKALQRTFAALGAPALRDAGSALSRLASYAAHVQASQAWARLLELLHYESERAQADLTVRLGADGSVRSLHVMRLREDRQSRFHVPLLKRWFGRLWLRLAGFRVSDDEVLDGWLDQVFEGVCPFLPPLLQLIGDLELYLSGLALRDGCLARGMPVCFAELVDEAQGADNRIVDLYNPLLFALEGAPVPCTIALGPRGVTTLVTGPNSGGKTRLLQAVGIFQLCAQAGMYAPARSAVIARVPGIFASLSQPAHAEQLEGRLGTELLRIRMLFERAEAGYLVLIDELCSGTSPSEGEELFQLVLELLAELGPRALVSTHFLKFAAALSCDAGALGLRFLQVELDARERPTYRFVPGVAETSLARQTAARLGVTREELRALMAHKRAP